MTAEAILERLRSLGARLSVAGDKLRVEAPTGVLTPELRRELIEHKAELLRLLRPFTPPVLPGPHGEDPLDFRRDPLTGAWVHEPSWWRRPAQASVTREARAPCPRCGGRRFWISVCHSAICENCHPPGAGDKLLGWLVAK